MEPSDLASAVHARTWDWLVDLPQRLDLVFELIDERQTPLLPARSTPDTIRRMLAEREPALVSAISGVLQSRAPFQAATNGFQILCLPAASTGALIGARALQDEPTDGSLRDLDLAGSWIVNAIEESLAKPPTASSVEPYRMASLRRILDEAMSRGSVRKVVGAFVEALGVWDDVRCHVYAASASGAFFRYVSPVGSIADAAPAELNQIDQLRDAHMVRLGREAIDAMGFASDPGDALILRLPTGNGVTWLLVFTGSIDGLEEVRLTIYADMLRDALNEVIAAATMRVTAAVARHDLPANDSLTEAAEGVLAQLTSASGGQQSALALATATGRQLLAAGNRHLLLAPDDHTRQDRLVIHSSDASGTLTLVVERDQPRFTAFERELLSAGLTALHPRVQAALHSAPDTERRRQFRPVDTLFDQLAAETVDAGQPASVIVVSVDRATAAPGLIRSWVGRIRTQLRAGDFAGILSDTEIAVLLCDTSADQAAVVSARLKLLIESDEAAGSFLHPALGMTTRSPESAFDGSLVGAARAGVIH